MNRPQRLKTRMLGACFAAQALLLDASGGGAHSTQLAALGANTVPSVATPQPQQAAGAIQPVQPLVTPQPTQIASSPPAQTTAVIDTRPVQVHMNYVLPAQSSQATQSVKRRKPQYIASTNTQIGITVTPFGGSPTVFGPSACASGSCAINFTATPGPNTIAFVLTDGTNTLSRFSTTTIVQPATINTLNFTANPVVNSVTLSLNTPSVTAGTAINDLLTVSALDLGGNTIVGPGQYVDSNGNPVSLNLSVSNNQAGGRGTVMLQGPSRITAPGQAAVYARYDGNWLASSTISVTSNSAAIASVSTTLTTVPNAVEYPSGLGAGASPYGIVTGRDGNLWIANFVNAGGGSGNTVTRMTPTGSTTQYTAGLSANSSTGYLTNGADGNLYIVGQNSRLAKMPLGGPATEFPIALNVPIYPVLASDGNIWFTEESGNDIVKLSGNGVATYYPVTGSKPRGILSGPDGNLWVIFRNTTKISRVTPSGVQTDFTYADIHTGFYPDGLAIGSDGNIWFADTGGYYICRYSFATQSVTVFSTGITNNAGIGNVISGPDGNIWFNEGNVGKIGRMTTSGVMIAEYGTANGITSPSGPNCLTIGPDGNIWFTKGGGNKVAKFIL